MTRVIYLNSHSVNLHCIITFLLYSRLSQNLLYHQCNSAILNFVYSLYMYLLLLLLSHCTVGCVSQNLLYRSEHSEDATTGPEAF